MEIQNFHQNLHWDPASLVSPYNYFSDDEDFESGSSTAKLYERSRIKALAGERESVQRKTFTKWINSHLSRVNCRIEDLGVDLRDGKMLLKLLEILSGERLPRPTRGKMRIHCLENVDKSLNFLNEQHVHLENVGAHDIVDGNVRLTLGLIWTIILRFQMQDIMVEELDSSETRSAKDALLLWCQMKTAGYSNVNIRNFTTSWRDGLAFNALIHKHRPDLIDYSRLSRSHPLDNLDNAFTVADTKLGLTRLLDPEDVNVEQPDERSIITYVVTYYHYFNKMKADSVHSRRIGRVINQAIDSNRLVEQYEQLTSDLLEWIQRTIEILNDRTFATSLPGVQQQLTAFNTYRIEEKPPKFTEKGDLEILLFIIRSKMRANNQRVYTPPDGYLIADINRAWEMLEKAEHAREIALRDELIRQEKLEQLATQFDRKAGMREAWLTENKRLIVQDNFGNDLPSVEAATKKHEAIETDICSYEERVSAVISIARELESEHYHDIARIIESRDNVVRLWHELLDMMHARRARLELSRQIHQIFQEERHLLDCMEDIKNRLRSEDYGKHLMGVEDLLQKHELIEADIRVLYTRMNQILEQAESFVKCNFDGKLAGYNPVPTELVSERGDALRFAYSSLVDLAECRRRSLEESRKMWGFLWEMADEEQWMKEKGQLMSSPDLGHDLISVERLLKKHKGLEDEIHSRQSILTEAIQRGEELIEAGNLGSDRIADRIEEMRALWEQLVDLTTERKRRLLEAYEFYQFVVECDDADSWMLETLLLVSNEDVGNKLSATESLIRKNQSVMDSLENYRETIGQLHTLGKKVASYSETDATVVAHRLQTVDHRFEQLLDLAQHRRQQRLLDALSMFKLFDVADSVVTWIMEKEKLLVTLVPVDKMEQLEVVRHRFECIEAEMANNAEKVGHVNRLSENLLSNQHPDSEQILGRLDSLNDAWNHLADVVEDRKRQILSAYLYNQFMIECQETANWILEKARLIESTDELDNDLEGIMQIQRRLSGLQRDLCAIEAKVDHLDGQAETIIRMKPESRVTVENELARIHQLWDELRALLKNRDERLTDSSELQRFLQDLDHFQVWLSKTQRLVASEDLPKDLQETEKCLLQLQQLRQEIEAMEPEFTRLMAYGARVTEGQTDAQYVFLAQRLSGLTEGWEALLRMLAEREGLLHQCLAAQLFFRDAVQLEQVLNQQERLLAKEEIPVLPSQLSVEMVQNMIKQHENFMKLLAANNDKIGALIETGRTLIKQGNYASDRIRAKCDQLADRRQINRRAEGRRLQLQEQLMLQEFCQDVDDIEEWISEKMILTTADNTDMGSRDPKALTARYSRYKAFEEEVGANKEKLEKVIKIGEALIRSYPHLAGTIRPKLDSLQHQWDELNAVIRDKIARIADANREMLFDETAKSMMSWLEDVNSQILTVEETTHELGLVEIGKHMQEQDKQDRELEAKRRMLQDLQLEQPTAHADKLSEQFPDRRDEFDGVHTTVRVRLDELAAPLADRRSRLIDQKWVRELLRDLEEECRWAEQKLAGITAAQADLPTSLQTAQQMVRRHRLLAAEVDNRGVAFGTLCQEAESVIDTGHPQSTELRSAVYDLRSALTRLQAAVLNRQRQLDLAEAAQRYLFEAGEAEAWIGEQELVNLTLPSTGSEAAAPIAMDEQSAVKALKRHDQVELLVKAYATEVRRLGDSCQALVGVDGCSPGQRETLLQKQARVDRQYAGLRQLCGERRRYLENCLRLYKLFREITDLEAWLAERTVVASSYELGVDYDHCCLLRDRFAEFARETNDIGRARIHVANQMCDTFISLDTVVGSGVGNNGNETGDGDLNAVAPQIAEWKDRINEAWADLLELIETRIQLLKTAWDLFKFVCDCQDLLDRINEKAASISEEVVGRDAKTISSLQRKHTLFEHELARLAQQVEGMVDTSRLLLPQYSGDREREISAHRDEVLAAWRRLQRTTEQRRASLLDTGDFHRFLSMIRELLLWMGTVRAEMETKERPKDVSGIEIMLNNHRSLRAEMDAREENVSICLSLGRTLLQRGHARREEARDKCIQLVTERIQLADLWSDRWEHLQLLREVYQFARDAAIADSWLGTQEIYLANRDLGDSLDETLSLLQKHLAFERVVATQEDRFRALRRLTTLELRARERTRETEANRERERHRRILEVAKEFLPPTRQTPGPSPARVGLTAGGAGIGRSPPHRQIPEESMQAQQVASPERAIKVQQLLQSRQPAGSPSSGAVSASHSDPSGSLLMTQSAQVSISSQAPSQRPLPMLAGPLVRKHEWESGNRKAPSRSWHELYLVLEADQLTAYKDQRHYRVGETYHQESPVSLEGAVAAPATDYVKRTLVFRLKLASGSEYLFQAGSETALERWVTSLNCAAASAYGPVGGSALSRSATMPLAGSMESGTYSSPSTGLGSGGSKRRFFTLSRKK